MENDPNLKHRAQKKSQRSLLDRFVERVRQGFQFFQNKEIDSNTQLSGRILDLQGVGESIRNELIQIKSSIQRHHLYTPLEGIIDSLLQDIERMQNSLKSSLKVTQQTQLFKKYSEWIDKAKKWIDVCGKLDDTEGVCQAIIDHAFEQFSLRVDRDLKVLEDYQEHRVEGVQLEPKQKLVMVEELMSKTGPYLGSLQALKSYPKNLSVDDLQMWKDKIDRKRETLFEGALHTIDRIIQPYLTRAEIEDVVEEVTTAREVTYIATLSKKVGMLEQNVRLFNDSLQDEQNVENKLAIKLNEFQTEIHHLNRDLHLTPDLHDKVHQISLLIINIQDRLDNKAG